MDALPFKYRAFLSYSHRDKHMGEWLHAALERYQIPRDLRGKAGKFGALPANLRPIFRDRDDLEAGHSLTEQVDTALAGSEALIVMCSPDSAKSAYVNEEIRRFKTLGRSERIYAIIVNGEPGDPARECFPPSLREKFDVQGQRSSAAEEPIAADAREKGDGKELALLKVVAGVLGVDLDELRKREAIEAKKRQRRAQLVAGLMAVLALAAGVSALYAVKQRNLALLAQQEAEQRRHEAERRYDQALDSTLRLVTTVATLRSAIDGAKFGIAQVEAKGESDDFMDFLRSAEDPNEVWFRLSGVLMRYQNDLPPELKHYRERLMQAGLPLQWTQHAELIMANVLRRGGNKTQYQEQLRSIRERVTALGGEPTKDCITATPPTHADTNKPAPPGTEMQMQQVPLLNNAPMMQQPLAPQTARALPPCE